tara:strand:+ start:4550 stop:4753 length:204 start_codon:yes stop_codon:yes gene_type:complete
MDNITKSDYNKVYKEQTDKQYDMKMKLMLSDIDTIVKSLNEAESVIKLIADTYHLTEATGYFNDTPK